VVWATSKKYGLQFGNMKFHTWNKDCISICTIMSNFMCIFPYIMCNKKHPNSNWKNE
jgi:hypothetical protein